jgi:hypothetical protein
MPLQLIVHTLFHFLYHWSFRLFWSGLLFRSVRGSFSEYLKKEKKLCNFSLESGSILKTGLMAINKHQCLPTTPG